MKCEDIDIEQAIKWIDFNHQQSNKRIDAINKAGFSLGISPMPYLVLPFCVDRLRQYLNRRPK